MAFILKLFLCLLFISVNNFALAEDKKPLLNDSYKNFITLKFGEALPTPLYGNTGLKAGKETSVGGFVIGRNLNDIVGIDIEYSKRATNYNQQNLPAEDQSTSWKMSSDAYMVNLFLNLMTDSRIIPYIRGGGGLAVNDSDDYWAYDQDTDIMNRYPGKTTRNFASQFGAGTKFQMNNSFGAQFEYMYINRGTVETQGYFIPSSDNEANDAPPIKANFSDHLFTVGITYNF